MKVYVFKRVLENGDSTTRVAADLKNLYNVDVDMSTLLDWIQKKKEQDMNAKPGINASPPRTKEEPKNLEQWETEQLATFLRDNTWAKPYRDVLLQFYTTLEDPPSDNPSLDFLDGLVRKESHKDLKSAVKTLKAKKEYVFNFVKAWKAHPKWKKIRAFKVNPESTIKKVNTLSRVQYGFRLDESARYKIEQYLKCPVMVSQSVLKDREEDRP